MFSRKLWKPGEGGKSLGEIKIQRGIFERDAFSQLLFAMEMMPLSHILRKCTAGYKLSKLQEKNSYGRHQTVCEKRKKIWKF